MRDTVYHRRPERVVVGALCVAGERRWRVEESLDELSGLVQAAGGLVVERVIQDYERMAKAAGGLPTMVDFNFSAILSFRKAKSLLDEGAIGRLRHVAVNWNVENQGTRLRPW